MGVEIAVVVICLVAILMGFYIKMKCLRVMIDCVKESLDSSYKTLNKRVCSIEDRLHLHDIRIKTLEQGLEFLFMSLSTTQNFINMRDTAELTTEEAAKKLGMTELEFVKMEVSNGEYDLIKIFNTYRDAYVLAASGAKTKS